MGLKVLAKYRHLSAGHLTWVKIPCNCSACSDVANERKDDARVSASCRAHRELRQAEFEANRAAQDNRQAEAEYKAALKRADETKRAADAAKKNLDAAKAKETAVRKAYDAAVNAVDKVSRSASPAK